MKPIFCPKCGSPDIHPAMGGMLGTYQCKKCGYVGTLIIQKEFIKTMDNETNSLEKQTKS
ncbi:MAG: hypothetical protein KKG59_00775 [Nanoarchaeota archaeon]|nr:hypothetical protein [Nanoarchaeota archaeon]